MKTTGSLQLVFTMPRVWDLSMAGNTSQRDFLFENVRSAEVRKEMRQFCMDSVIHHMIQARDGEAKQKKKGDETCGDTVAKCGTEQEVLIFFNRYDTRLFETKRFNFCALLYKFCLLNLPAFKKPRKPVSLYVFMPTGPKNW